MRIAASLAAVYVAAAGCGTVRHSPLPARVLSPGEREMRIGVEANAVARTYDWSPHAMNIHGPRTLSGEIRVPGAFDGLDVGFGLSVAPLGIGSLQADGRLQWLGRPGTRDLSAALDFEISIPLPAAGIAVLFSVPMGPLDVHLAGIGGVGGLNGMEAGLSLGIDGPLRDTLRWNFYGGGFWPYSQGYIYSPEPYYFTFGGGISWNPPKRPPAGP